MNCVLYIIPLSWKKENIIRKIYKNLKLDIDISVLQSASIKTIGEYNINTMKRIFTLHFATINTVKFVKDFSAHLLFTIHFATINTSLIISSTVWVSLFTIQKQESIQSIDNIRFLDVFCVLTVHYSNKQI